MSSRGSDLGPTGDADHLMQLKPEPATKRALSSSSASTGAAVEASKYLGLITKKLNEKCANLTRNADISNKLLHQLESLNELLEPKKTTTNRRRSPCSSTSDDASSSPGSSNQDPIVRIIEQKREQRKRKRLARVKRRLIQEQLEPKRERSTSDEGKRSLVVSSPRLSSLLSTTSSDTEGPKKRSQNQWTRPKKGVASKLTELHSSGGGVGGGGEPPEVTKQELSRKVKEQQSGIVGLDSDPSHLVSRVLHR